MTDATDEAALLAANEGFYLAMTRRDYAAMDRLWARNEPVACAHPGWPPIFGRLSVMESWAGILGNSEAPRIRCHKAKALLYGTLAMVLCYELINRDVLLATNVFVKEDGDWRMAHHHAGPTIARPEEPATLSKRLH